MNKEGPERKNQGFLSQTTDKIKKQLLIFHVLRTRDRASFGKLYDLYVTQIYRFIYFKVLRNDIAEDLTAETFLRIWQYLSDTGRGKKQIENFQALLYRIARNAVIDFYRTHSHESTFIDSQAMERASLEVSDPHNPWEGQGVAHDELMRLLPRLKDLYREVVVLRYIEGQSMREISAITGKSGSHVRVILHRALKTLQEMVHEPHSVRVNESMMLKQQQF